MKYRVTNTPTHCQGDTGDFDVLRIGDVVEVENPVPDSDGDVYFTFPGEGWDHIALSCLGPYIEGQSPDADPREAAYLRAVEYLPHAAPADVLALARFLGGE